MSFEISMSNLISWIVRTRVLIAGFALLFVGLALIIVAGFLFLTQGSWLIKYLFAFGIGGGVGAAELVSRYKDRPERAITTYPAAFYVLVNGLGSLIALYLISVFPEWLKWESLDKWDTGTTVKAVLLAGFSAILFFRTSLFKLRVGDSDLAVGPSIVLDSLLVAADRAVDRVMAQPRAEFVQGLLGNVSFEKAASILPAHCLALMQNVSGSESQRIAGVVNALRAEKDMPDKIKSFNLGLILLTVVGERVLQIAVKGLQADLQDSTAVLMNNVAEVMANVQFERAFSILPDYCFTIWPKPIEDGVKVKFMEDARALAKLPEVPPEYKVVLLGIRLARLTDGATLEKAVQDLGSLVAKDTPSSANAPAL
jgi:hypothetical protein